MRATGFSATWPSREVADDRAYADLGLANKVVELAQQYPEVFPRPDTGE